MDRHDTLNALRDAKTNRERIFNELSNLHARAAVEGNDGLDERIGNLNRAIANADERVAELEATYGRNTLTRQAELEDGLRDGR